MGHALADSAPDARKSSRRVNGIVLLLLLVGGGLGVTSVLFRWKAGDLIAQRRADLASAPREGEPRLERWTELNRVNIVLRLEQLRVSARLPYLVTHELVSEAADTAPELLGVDLTELSPEWVVREGLRVVVRLPAARNLGRGWIGADKALYVPKVRPGEPAPDLGAAERAAGRIAEHALERLIEALPRDIPGAELVVRVGATGEVEPSR